MESMNKLTMCRLCLCQNESFMNIFQLNDWQGYVVAEVISDMLHFQISEADGYPHAVCSMCLMNLTNFMQFKECCQRSKVTYDKMFVSRERLEEHGEEMLNIKQEELDIPGDESEETCEGTNTKMSFGPILLKHEVLSFNRDSHTQEELIESDAFINADAVEPTATSIVDSTEVQLTPAKTVTDSQYQQSVVNKTPRRSPKRTVGAGSCTVNVIANDDSVLEKSENVALNVQLEASLSGTMERLEGQFIPFGERMHTDPLYQGDMSIKKDGEKEREEKKTGEGETASGKGEREKLECSHCGKVSMTKLGLARHMRLHAFGNRYKCDVCDKLFPSNSALKRHVLTHAVSKSYRCIKCSKCFKLKHHLKTHMKTHTGSKPYKCTECSKSFSQNSNLKTHMCSHVGCKPHKCVECSKCFVHMAHLKIHMRSHTGCKPYKCAECSKCFCHNYDLKIHMQSHTGSTPFKCESCSKGFTDIRNLRRHLLVHSKDKPHECHKCRSRFSQRGSLKVHLGRHCKGKKE